MPPPQQESDSPRNSRNSTYSQNLQVMHDLCSQMEGRVFESLRVKNVVFAFSADEELQGMDANGNSNWFASGNSSWNQIISA